MTLSISARLTLWYTVILALVLGLAGTGLYFAQGRLDRARLADDLRNAADTVTVSVNAEIDEGDTLEQAVQDQLRELLLPGRAFALYDTAGHLLGARWQGLDPSAVGPIDLTPAEVMRSIRVRHGHWRILQQAHAHRGLSYRLVVAEPLHDLASQREALRAGLLLVIPLALLLSAAGGWWLARQALRPLSVMATQAREITEHDLGSRLHTENPADELGTFARAFNDLLSRLEAALQGQRQFMADASHELRTPVSVARTTAEVTLDAPRRPEEDYREALDTIGRQMRRMTRMVDQMLVLARADAGMYRPQPSDFYLDELMAECARTAAVLARRGVTVLWQVADEVAFRGDEELLRQMVLNLLDNAVRHCRDGGCVRLTLTVERRDGGSGREAVIAVSDEGPGIPPGDRERVFERFVRLDPARDSSGVGLGLSIARWVADVHGGSLTIARTGPDGTLFVARVPAPDRAGAIRRPA
ncbi:MAG: HAMP domain-containing protein [Acidobacteriota bacterium]|nr:HAMP domain-containing protein [Acidobacteriota bacterium]